jgi:tetratricopeptide (TPR) repeat protein
MVGPEDQTSVTDGNALSTGRLPESATDPQATTGTEQPLSMSAAPPTSGERYVFLGEIARGGMGVIYRATDTALGREVAVKLLQERYAADSGVVARFGDEARIAAQLQHPGIPPVHDVGTLPDGRPFLAMKLIKGQTLEALLAARADVAAERGRFVAVFEQACQAIAYAHSRRVIHRDLKPSNVMVGAFGEVQVMDWGLAKVLANRASEAPAEVEPAAATQVVSQRDSDGSFTLAGSVLGTPAYMPPEQAAGLLAKVDGRSDVFGLGAILAVILTGQPPFAAASADTTRGLAALGDVAACYGRLDDCGAEPELIALCKRCLSRKPADRPADAGEVARAVAALRAAADERARRAELDRARLEGEKAADAARAQERRKRRRLLLGAAAALVAAALAGLGAVLAVQQQANAELEAKNRELAEQQDEVEARFALAQKAIATFHTGVSEDALLRNRGLAELRTHLLREAAGFYGDLEQRLAGKTDSKSRLLLADGYAQLGDLTARIDQKAQALAVHRKALALRRELAAAPGADVDARLAVARSLNAVADLLRETGDLVGALAAYEEVRDLAAALETESPTVAVRAVLGQAHHGVGGVLSETGKRPEALQAYEKARDIRQSLADESPANALHQENLANSHNSIGVFLSEAGKFAEAQREYEKALASRQRLADGEPTATRAQSRLASSHGNIAFVLYNARKLNLALQSWERARTVLHKLADANLAVTEFQEQLAGNQLNIGICLFAMGRMQESLQAYQRARDIYQRLADADSAVTQFQDKLAYSQDAIGLAFKRLGRPAEALQAYEAARALRQKLADANPAGTAILRQLAETIDHTGSLHSMAGRTEDALRAQEAAREIRGRLVDADPSNAFWRRDLARSQVALGALLAQAGKPAEALKEYEAARGLQQGLAESHPTVPDYRSELARTQYLTGRLLARQGRFEEAFTYLDKAEATCRQLAATYPLTGHYALRLGYSYAFRGTAHLQAGHASEAAGDLRRGIELWTQNETLDPDDRVEQARALALLSSLGAVPKSGVTQAEAATFADRAVAALRSAVQAGWANRDQLKDPDFDSLRKREDFQNIIKKMEARSAARGGAKPEALSSQPPRFTSLAPAVVLPGSGCGRQ